MESILAMNAQMTTNQAHQDDFLMEDFEALEFLEGDLGTRDERIRALKYLVKEAEKNRDKSIRGFVLAHKSKFLDPRVTKKEVTELFFYLWEKITGQPRATLTYSS